MSLIVARKDRNGIYIVGDTKLTLINDEHDYNLPKDFVIKSRIFDVDICISFAGHVNYAAEAFKKIEETQNIEIIKKILIDTNIISNLQTDFILSCYVKEYKIFEIKNGEIQDVQSAWIGSQRGFDMFQRFFHDSIKVDEQPINTASFRMIRSPSKGEEQGNLFSKMYESMKFVIENEKIQEVGGFVVPIAFFEEKFQHMDYVNVFNHRIDFEELTKGKAGWQTVPFGTAQEGGFCINFSGSKDELNDKIAIHFLQGEFGVIFQNEELGILTPTLFQNTDEIDFVAKVLPEFNIKPGILAGHGSNRFFNKGLKEFNKSLFENALEHFYRAIEIDSQEWGKTFNKENKFRSFNEYMDETGDDQIHIVDGRPDLNFTKAVFFFIGASYYKLGDRKKAIHYFSHTIQIDSHNIDALNQRACCYFEEKQYEKAIPDLDVLIEEIKHEGLYLNRGLCYKNIGELEKALFNINKSLEINPNFENAKLEKRLLEK